MLDNIDSKKAFFKKIAEEQGDDHPYIRTIKAKIDEILEQELEYLGFQEQLKVEERKAMETDIYKEVITKENFYFKIDEEKKEKNLKIFNVRAHGIIMRNPHVILPHEHVHIQHYLDAEYLRGENLTKVYAYYNYLIDLHISQIRPKNLNEYSYIPPWFNQLELSRGRDQHLNNMFFEFYHRWREPTRTWMS